MVISDSIEIVKENKEYLEIKIEDRNKSYLQPHHYQEFHGTIPDFSSEEKNIMPLEDYRSLFGTYGNASNIEIRALWPSKEEMRLAKEREQFEYPNEALEMIHIARKKIYEEQLEEMESQRKIVENMKGLNKWIRTVKDKMYQKEQDAKIAKQKRQMQIDEVKTRFGYYIDPSDEKFQVALAEKDEEDRKRQKKAKKLQKEKDVVEKLQAEAKRLADEGEYSMQQGDSIIEGQQLPPLPQKDGKKG